MKGRVGTNVDRQQAVFGRDRLDNTRREQSTNVLKLIVDAPTAGARRQTFACELTLTSLFWNGRVGRLVRVQLAAAEWIKKSWRDCFQVRP